MIRIVALATCLLFSSLHGAAAAAPPPRPGIDYDLLPSAQPTFAKGKTEVAEVFSYACHFCAEFQPMVNLWTRSMPAGVRWQYVPASFGRVVGQLCAGLFRRGDTGRATAHS